MKTAKQQALIDMNAEGIFIDVLLYQNTIIELTTDESINIDFRIYNGGHNSNDYKKTFEKKLNKININIRKD